MKIPVHPLAGLLAVLLSFPALLPTSPVIAQSAESPTPSAPAPAEKPAEKPAEAPKTNNWVTSATLGFSLTRGNSKTLLLTGNILTEKKWDKNELRLGADGTYGEDNSVKNAESIHGFSQYNRLITERWYAYGRVDVLHDDIADVDYRVTLSPGIGYYFVKNAQTTFSGEFGPGYILEKQGGKEHDYMTLRIAERLEHKLNDRVRLWESVEYLPQVDKFEHYIINSEAGIDTAITKKFSLKVFVLDTYDSEPAKDRVKNDLKLVAGLGYKF